MKRHGRIVALGALLLLAALGSRCAGDGRQRVIVQLRAGFETSLSGRSFTFEGAEPGAVADLNRLLTARPVVGVERMFEGDVKDDEPGGKGDPSLLFAISVATDATDAEVQALVQALLANPLVERAYEEAIPTLAVPQ